MYTKLLRKIVLKSTYGFGHCAGDGGNVGHCY
jgi:hypothetical protein